ncbi:coenzyme F420 hydrogenase/dehydrogenase beta subunit domain protein [Desulfofundulus kuznetsovii DSM 6115]|uniref:Coenzyme F420 hydrogenase/dehydrogenase beta subunit domain protein n=2 Tax=Peptococcaceae TaxID=186807 RepID=A0AAU8PCH0_DESK7|nr:coenzyme F420 hydrogenase/dehydrogenase beta subunit domain protein [Desulfofundulus kuznetsovii DSM 6115]
MFIIMSELTRAIQETAQKLLQNKEVELVVGFAEGSLPLRNTPCFVRQPEEAQRLVWGYGCENNLANYLRQRPEKVAVVAKGCDSRSIVELIKENQIDRNKLVVIGVPCRGMIDRKKVTRLLAGKELLEAEIRDGQVVLKGKEFSESVPLEQLLHDTCLTCQHPNPVLFDIMMGEPVPVKEADSFVDVANFEVKAPAEKRAYLIQELSRCIRCYACRQACPMCFCEECFVDCSMPQWLSKSSLNVQDNVFFQAVRALHLAGRCVDCGACDRACPMGIDLRTLTRKMVKDVQELFGYTAGVSLDQKPPLAAPINTTSPATFNQDGR